MSLFSRIFYGLMIFICLAIAAYASQYWLPGTMGSEGQLTNRLGPYALAIHAAGGGLALVLGPFQFLRGLRSKRPGLHRLMGRFYVLACSLSGIAGLALAIGSFGGLISSLGFATLAVLWLYTTWKAVRSALRRQFTAHRAWMVRSFALTLAAVTLRVLMPSLMMSGVDPERTYEIVAWACWLPNLALAEIWLGLRRSSLEPAGLA